MGAFVLLDSFPIFSPSIQDKRMQQIKDSDKKRDFSRASLSLAAIRVAGLGISFLSIILLAN